METDIKIWTKTKCPISLNNYRAHFLCLASVSHSWGTARPPPASLSLHCRYDLCLPQLIKGMIISQGMCKGPGPWQVSGRAFLALWPPYHAQFRTRIRDDWGYAPSPSTSALWGICQQRRQGREFGDVLQNGLSQWLGKKAAVVTKICNRDS